MTREELRDHIQRLIERDLELVCRVERTGPTYGNALGIRVLADGGEYVVLVSKFVHDDMAERGRECTPEEVAELDRTEDW